MAVKIEELLKKIGLTKTEAVIYLRGLNYSSVGVNELVKQTGVKRTTIYHALGTLIAKGLVAEKGAGRKLEFIFTPPDSLRKMIDGKISLLEKQKEAVSEILPLFQQRPEKDFEVYHYQGIGGVKAAVGEALYCRSGRWDIIAPPKNFFSDFDQEYARYFLEARKKKNITTRSLWEKDPSRRLLTAEEIKQRQPRFLPQVMYGKFKSTVILFDNKVALISSFQELSAVLIKSEEIYNTLEAIFEGLWTAAESYPSTK